MAENKKSGLSAPDGSAPSASPAYTADEAAYVIDRLAKMLAGVAIALKGPDLAQHRHSYHDLVEVAEKTVLELDLYRTIYGNTIPAEPSASPAVLTAQVRSRLEFEAVGLKRSTNPIDREASDALLSLLAAAPATPQPADQAAPIPLDTIREWAAQRIRACGPAGVTDQVALLEDAVRWAESQHRDFPTQAAPAVPLLAPDHKGMRVSYSGMLSQAANALVVGCKAPGLAEGLRQLQGHLGEVGARWYAGDIAVVDEILQLYCVSTEARAFLATKGGAA